MSTKIYNGYKSKYMSMDELIHLLIVMRHDLNKIRMSVLRSKFTHPESNQEQFDKEFKEFNERIDKIKKSNYRDPEFDFTFDCCIFPVPNKDYILYMFFTEMKEYMNYIRNCPHWNFEYYGYWNNTDQPDGVTDEEWEIRKSDWDSVLEPTCIPSKQGYSYTFFDFNDRPWKDELYV